MKNIKLYSSIFFFLLFHSFYSFSFEPNYFKKLPSSLSISHQSIRAIEQDKDGFIWLGTQDGLSRFDGYQVNTYHHDSDDSHSISHNIVSTLLVDQFNHIWVGTRGGGINVYQANDNNFLRLNQNDVLSKNSSINTLFEDSTGAIWIGKNKGLNKVIYQGKSKEFKIIKVADEQLSNISIRSIIEVNKQIWAGTEDSGIYVYSLSGEFISKLEHEAGNEQTIPSNIVRSLLLDHEGNVWIGTIEGGLSKYDPTQGQYVNFINEEANTSSLASNIVTALFEDSDRRLWVGTDKGLHIFDPIKLQFQRFEHANNNINSISNNMIFNLYEDKGNVIWIGTFSGINRWDPNVATFKQFNLENKSGLNNNVINTFHQVDKNSVLIGTYGGGVNELSLNTLTLSEPGYNQRLKDKRITSILSINDDIWLGTRASGVYHFNKTTNQLTTYKHQPKDPKSLSANSITDIEMDEEGTIWIATYHGGLNRFDGNNQFYHFKQNNQSDAHSLSSDHVFQILPDKNHIWLATDGGGVNKLNTITNEITVFNHDPNNSHSLSSNVAWNLFLDSDENLWVGTEASGLNIWLKEDRDNNNENFLHINTNHGLKSSTVYAIVEDNNQNIWFNTSSGISRYSPETKAFMHFDTSHGLLDLEYNFQAIYKTESNQLLFGSAKGFNMLDPNRLLSNQHAPDVRLTSVYSLNTKLKFDKPLSQLKLIEFDYTDKLIAFEYTGLDFASPESNQFKYRLQGFDKQWIEAGKLRRATYTNLAAGEYQLQIRAANNIGVWGEADVNLKIKVHPAPWNTWWAYVLYASLLALLLLMYSRIMTRKLVVEQQQRLKLKSEVYEKTQEFKNQNIELVALNQKLEASAISDKLTGVKSRRYLDIYIEQTSRLMTQIHQNISPAQQSLLPRLFLMLIKVKSESNPSDRVLINVAEYLGYKCAKDDLVVRWSDNIFAIIGSEKDNNVSLLAQNLAGEQDNIALENASLTVGYSFFPFNRERPQELSWDHTSIIAEVALNNVQNSQWLGIYQPIEYPFNYNQLVAVEDITQIKQLVTVKHS